jgi:hypothetical protein
MEVKSVDLYIKGSKARNAVNGKIIDNYEFNVLIPSHRIYTGCSGVAWADVIIDNKWLFTDRASNIMMLLLKCGITDGLINEKCTFAKRVNSFVVVPKRLIDDLDIQDILE